MGKYHITHDCDSLLDELFGAYDASKSEIQQRKKMKIIAIGKNIVDKISRVNTGGHSVGKILECYKFM